MNRLKFVDTLKFQDDRVLNEKVHSIPAVQLDTLDRFYMILPENGQGLEGLDLAEDRAKELKKVEQ